MVAQEGERNGDRKKIEEIMTENFQNSIKNMILLIKKLNELILILSTKQINTEHIVVQLLKGKMKILQTTRVK